jgi:Glutamyl-tRNA reductase
VAEGAAHLCEDIAAAKGIVEDEVRRFAVRKRSERLAPLIRALRERGSGPSRGAFPVRLQLLALAGRVEAVEALARGIVAKLHRDPIVRLKELSSLGNDVTKARVLAELFASTNAPSEAPGSGPAATTRVWTGRLRRSHD